ncbi:hypothetical protein ASH04_06895 [Rhodococcus sp. Leaf233]|nr:hypothetical protein ASH04_06895 [Rhodococcus sp. Leaf233]
MRDHLAAYRTHEVDRMPSTGPHKVWWQERNGRVHIGERQYIYDAVNPDCTVIYRMGEHIEVPTSVLRSC